MKRFFPLAIVLVIIFVLTGCKSVESSGGDNGTQPVESTAKDQNNEKEVQKDLVKNETAENELQVSWFENPPHIFIDKQSGELTGAVYDLLEQKIAPKMNVKLVWDKEGTSIPRQTANFEANTKPFASALLTKNPERESVSICSEKIFFDSQTAIAVKKDNPLNEIKKIDDILDLKIGYAEKSFVSEFMKDPRVQFDLVSTSNYHETNLKRLMSDRIDAVYAPDKAAFLELMKQMDLEDDIKILDIPESKAGFYVVFSKAANEFAEKYNEVVKDMDLEKEYLDMLAKYIDTSKL
ncbi:transporter substrate-binding domain-containing protein [Acetivibrio mesophilus]|uniref:ABC transporter substrate-binding protein n=1 Tax=Acetivibrio mesophilus TaxID=2487273 RepID=A0A4Q0I377_9FIRM|nr:transporter substrate-binding domain-containing protein [Acetivibrio mesophilus]ODM27752.1 ABC transporter substrate-binding protein [Clostridium sp. Bc-iso-3]RXE58145.1 ABC transporter substrate-binding protein [Acetivibrio mesophilus]HHV30563.1 amino acid ABC transporter substrate-binding protein [Clostridium sp.]